MYWNELIKIALHKSIQIMKENQSCTLDKTIITKLTTHTTTKIADGAKYFDSLVQQNI